MAKGISNGAVGGAEKSAEAIVAPKRAKGRIGSRFKDFNHSDDGQEKRSGKPPKLGDKRRRSGVPRYGRKVSKRMWREGEPKNTSNDDGVLPKPRSARNRHASWCGRGVATPPTRFRQRLLTLGEPFCYHCGHEARFQPFGATVLLSNADGCGAREGSFEASR